PGPSARRRMELLQHRPRPRLCPPRSGRKNLVKVLVTGSAGFIGFHVARRLIERGDTVVGFDVVNDYYNPALKEARLAVLDEFATRQGADYRFIRADIADSDAVDAAFAESKFDRVIHLAAQAGVRY